MQAPRFGWHVHRLRPDRSYQGELDGLRYEFAFKKWDYRLMFWIELQDLMVKVVQGNINVAGSYEEHLRDKDAVFIHMDCMFLESECVMWDRG